MPKAKKPPKFVPTPNSQNQKITKAQALDELAKLEIPLQKNKERYEAKDLYRLAYNRGFMKLQRAEEKHEITVKNNGILFAKFHGWVCKSYKKYRFMGVLANERIGSESSSKTSLSDSINYQSLDQCNRECARLWKENDKLRADLKKANDKLDVRARQSEMAKTQPDKGGRPRKRE